MKECKPLVEQIADIIGEQLSFTECENCCFRRTKKCDRDFEHGCAQYILSIDIAYDLANKIIDCFVYSVNELEITKKALELYVDWADECGIGYDNLGDLYEEYKEKIEAENMGYTEGLIFIAMEEAKKALS